MPGGSLRAFRFSLGQGPFLILRHFLLIFIVRIHWGTLADWRRGSGLVS
jgi:hypothetical protein